MELSDKNSFILTSGQWQKVCPPWRPSFSDETIYKSIISQFNSKSSVLILGATPEIRDIVYELKFDNRFVVDISSEMFEQMSLVRKCASDIGEEFIRADWLSLPFKSSTFDIIVSDLPFWVLNSINEHAVFVNECHRVLKKEGSFIVRAHFVDVNFWLLSPEALFRWIYEQGFKKIWPSDKFKDFFSSVLVDYCTDPITYIFNREKCSSFLNNYLNDRWFKKFILKNPKVLSGAFYKPLSYLINSLELSEEIALMPYLNHFFNYFVKSCAVKCVMPISYFLSLIKGKFIVRETKFHHALPNSPYYPIILLQKNL